MELTADSGTVFDLDNYIVNLSEPAGLNAVKQDNESVKLSWSAPANSNYINVFRSGTLNGEYQQQ